MEVNQLEEQELVCQHTGNLMSPLVDSQSVEARLQTLKGSGARYVTVAVEDEGGGENMTFCHFLCQRALHLRSVSNHNRCH